jgi:hypothetical protein
VGTMVVLRTQIFVERTQDIATTPSAWFIDL